MGPSAVIDCARHFDAVPRIKSIFIAIRKYRVRRGSTADAIIAISMFDTADEALVSTRRPRTG